MTINDINQNTLLGSNYNIAENDSEKIPLNVTPFQINKFFLGVNVVDSIYNILYSKNYKLLLSLKSSTEDLYITSIDIFNTIVDTTNNLNSYIYYNIFNNGNELIDTIKTTTKTDIKTSNIVLVEPDYYLEIVLTNSQTSPTISNFQTKIIINSSNYTSHEAVDLSNCYFSTDGAGKNILNSWLESGNSNTATETIYWVNLSSNLILSNSNLSIYLQFLPITNIALNTTTTGENPLLSTNYGEYDNGASVFSFYDNFAGTTLNSKWVINGATYSINNGLTLTNSTTSGDSVYIASNSAIINTPTIVEAYMNVNSANSWGSTFGFGLVPTQTYLLPAHTSQDHISWQGTEELVTLPTNILTYEPMIITNNQSISTSTPFEQEVKITIADYPDLVYGTALSNFEFFYANGVIIPAWIEKGVSGVLTIWLHIVNGIPASTSITIFIGCASSTTNLLSNTGISGVGLAPQLTSTYGEYDNGVSVFKRYYNFIGTADTSGDLTFTGATPTYTIDNMLEMGASSGGIDLKIYMPYLDTSKIITTAYFVSDSITGGSPVMGLGLFSNDGGGDGYTIGSADALASELDFGKTTSYSTAPTNILVKQTNTLPLTLGLEWIGTGNESAYINNSLLSSSTDTTFTLPASLWPMLFISGGLYSHLTDIAWWLVRNQPPVGVMPTITFNTSIFPALSNMIANAQNGVDYINITNINPVDSNYHLWGIQWLSSSISLWYENISSLITTTTIVPTDTNYLTISYYNQNSIVGVLEPVNVQWIRIRIYPPSGVMPSYTFLGVQIAGVSLYQPIVNQGVSYTNIPSLFNEVSIKHPIKISSGSELSIKGTLLWDILGLYATTDKIEGILFFKIGGYVSNSYGYNIT